MPVTDPYQIPYPAADDPIAAGAETIRQGMERIDNLIRGDSINYFPDLAQTTGAGWGTAGLVQEGWVDGPRMYLFVELRRAGPSLTGSATGGLGDDPFITVTRAGMQPLRNLPFSFAYRWGAATYGGSGEYATNGVMRLLSITPGTEITKRDNAGDWSVRINITFMRNWSS